MAFQGKSLVRRNLIVIVVLRRKENKYLLSNNNMPVSYTHLVIEDVGFK